MSDKTKIEWTDATWNPVTGCTKVSPGCDHCYAERVTQRWGGDFSEVKIHPDRFDQPLRWRRPRKVFVNSMSDLFHEQVTDGFLAPLFAVMAACPQHTFQILTKRHGRMRSVMHGDLYDRMVSELQDGLIDHKTGRTLARLEPGQRVTWPLSNVWLGVSVEDQKWADIRIPALLDTPAAVRFLSCEPLLGPIDLSAWLTERGRERAYRYHDNTCDAGSGGCYHPPCRCACHRLSDVRPDWVIVGGESGSGARPMHPEWARSLRGQCTAAGVPFLFKQWGEWVTEDQSPQDITLPATSWLHLGEDQPSVYKVGKKAAGRELDGRTWDEYPDVAS